MAAENRYIMKCVFKKGAPMTFDWSCTEERALNNAKEYIERYTKPHSEDHEGIWLLMELTLKLKSKRTKIIYRWPPRER